jgi:hypothetical protein
MTKRPIFATGTIAAAIAIALALTTPAFARGGGPGGGAGGGSSVLPPAPPVPPPSPPGARRGGGPQMRSAAMPRGFGGPGRPNTPPGWGHGQKSGWNGGARPPGMSHR